MGGALGLCPPAPKLCLSREATVTPGTLGAPALAPGRDSADRQTDGGASSGPGQRGGPTMYTVAVVWGARYLTRFSTEYTEM